MKLREMKMAGKKFEVLVIGGGPVGLALSLDLGMRGVSTLLVERRNGTITVPKMGYVNARTMEFCRRWDIAAAIKRHGWPAHLPRNVAWLTSLTGKKIAGFEYPSYDEMGVLEHTPEGGRRCSQLDFDPILLERLRQERNVEIRHLTRVEDVEDTGDTVRATLQDTETNATEIVEARFAVACDGSESGIRKSLGIAMSGGGPERHCTNVIFRSENLWRYLRHGPAVTTTLIGPEGKWATMFNVDGDRLWRLSIMKGDPANPLGSDEVGALIRRAVGADVPFEIQSIMPWETRSRLAEQFRRGRIFLAGDAAHIMPPNGGLGMNSGVGDAMDLSWKLAAVLRGWGGEGLLDSYEAERQTVLDSNIREAVENNKRQMGLPHAPEVLVDGPAGDAMRQRMREVLETGGYKAVYEQEATVLGYRYANSPLVAGTQADVAGPAAETRPAPRGYVQSAVPGGRAPHVWLRDGSSTLDYFWDGFSIVKTRTSAAGNPQGLLARAQNARVPMQFLDFSAEPRVGETYGADFVLVRPDGHIVWMGNHLPHNQQADDLLQKITGHRL
jgi:2-polyprenyl-6-methoxyphenol hydroxylase-like FAD-dependent oxidoreductase